MFSLFEMPVLYDWMPAWLHLKRMALPTWLAASMLAVQLYNAHADLDLRESAWIYDAVYEETTEEEENPGRGFYQPAYVHYKKSDNELPTYYGKLVHLRLDLTEFSGAYNGGEDEELTGDMLDSLDALLSDMERKQVCAIIRFSYDPWFGGKKTYEPDMAMILRHQEQIGAILSRYPETVASLECGIFGKWGEMHGSDACTQENFNLVIDKWLEVLPQSIPISVRTISQYCGWCGISPEELTSQITMRGQKEWRVGIYDDGYLCSDTDLGTYMDRERDINWLSSQGKHTLFGGEAGAAVQSDGEIALTTTYLEKEAFRTHLSYLNQDWNAALLDRLKEEKYYGHDERYYGLSGDTYLRNHMGYRFVLRGVRLTKEVPRGWDLILEVNVENVGFANLVKQKDLTLVLTDGDESLEYEIYKSQVASQGAIYDGDVYHDASGECNLDPTTWDSQSISTVSVRVTIPEDARPGTYKAYLRIAAPEDQDGIDEKGSPAKQSGMEETGSLAQRNKQGEVRYPVRFANLGEEAWNATLRANYLGTFQVTEPPAKLDWSLQSGISWK
ncbi:MAG: DUF4832 domain-containing protein [Lachnospiraceae bacterium]|nr:DUF4832 domain-containing protein [Lachnospiraceae bacterium]